MLMGPPGAGKGTQGDLLAERFGVPRLSTGDMLREARRAGTEVGREARRYMDAGELVPDEVILRIIEEALDEWGRGAGFVLDGFPRTLPQAEGLARLLERRGEPLDAVVNLRVPEEEVVRRLSGRRLCEACGEVTHVVEVGEEGDCPACGAGLRQREDDRPETVRRRLEVYREQTEPVLAWCRTAGVPVLDVDGSGPVREVADRIATALESASPADRRAGRSAGGAA